MAFMIPVYENGSFVRVEDEHGESTIIPADCYIPAEIGGSTEVAETLTGWFCRLSAPGYMDCTDWDGPFETEDEARAHIADTFDVDPDSGDDLEDEE